MTTHSRLIPGTTAAAALFYWGLPEAHAQEARRNSLTGEATVAARKAELQRQRYNFSLGPVKIRSSAGLKTEFNDNTSLTPSGGKSDLLLSPNATIEANWTLTELNTLRFFLDLSYTHYLRGTGKNSIQVAPGSELSFDIFAGDLLFNLHDRISHTEDPTVDPTINGVTNLGLTENTAGLKVTADLNQLLVSGGYDYHTVLSSSQRFSGLDRNSHLLFARAALAIDPETRVGFEVGGGITEFDRPILNSSRHYSAGPFFEAELSPSVSLRAAYGYVHYSFSNNGTIGDGDNASGPYGEITLIQRLTPALNNTTSFRREVRIGTSSNYVKLYTARNELDWAMIRNGQLRIPIFYENGNESGAAGEHLERIGAGLTFSYSWNPRLQSTLGYSFLLKDSSQNERDYRQNRVTLEMDYRF